MAKRTTKKSSINWDGPMNLPMKLFLAGCAAELYLMLVRRFYVNGSIRQVVAWDGYLLYIGIAALVIGAALGVFTYVKRKTIKNAEPLAWVAGLIGFVGISSLLIKWNMTILALLMALIACVTIIVILWGLFDRECSLALSALGVGLLGLWTIRRGLDSLSVANFVRVGGVILALILLCVAALVFKNTGKGRSGIRFGKFTVLPATADPRPVMLCCGISAAALVVGLIGLRPAYYCTWVLIAVIFALAVYYTVKQL